MKKKPISWLCKQSVHLKKDGFQLSKGRISEDAAAVTQNKLGGGWRWAHIKTAELQVDVTELISE
jgi:hypothetical protein